MAFYKERFSQNSREVDERLPFFSYIFLCYECLLSSLRLYLIGWLS